MSSLLFVPRILLRSMSSLVRQNFSVECEKAINNQINVELYASYLYMSMAYHFDREDVALPGLHWYFKKASNEEREHAMKFMKYLNKRGGRIVLDDIKRPSEKWETPVEAMTIALGLEKSVNESLLDLQTLASKYNDANLCDFLETEYLKEQVDAIKEMSDHITNLKRVGKGLGEYIFDKNIDTRYVHETNEEKK